MYMVDVEHEKFLLLLEEVGSRLRDLKYQLKQMCLLNEYVKGSTIRELCDTIEYNQREFDRLDDMLTELEKAF